MLPDIDGIEVCRRIRQSSDVPILMLTARDEDVDKIIGLEVGADDYLTKPFNPRELVARVKSILRRVDARARRDARTKQIRHGDLSIDAGRREVKVGEEEIQLAPKEFDLLWELLDHRGLVLTRDQLLERVWGYTFAGDTRTVDVHVRQLRRKLGDASPIVTVWGVGYKVSPGEGRVEGHGQRLGKGNACSGRCAFACRRSSWRDRALRARRDRRSRSASSRTTRGSRPLHELRREASGLDAALRRAGRAAVDEAPEGARRPSPAREARAGDRRPDLLRRRVGSSPASTRGLRRARRRTSCVDRARRRRMRSRSSSRPPDAEPPLPRGRAAAPARAARPCFGALVVAKPKAELRDALADPALAARDGVRSSGSSSPARSPGTSRAGSRGRCSALSDAADEIAEGNYDVECPTVPGGGEIGHLADAVPRDGGAARSEAEELERNFLMTVSHELRTPLTAIRGHVAALREGLVDDAECARRLARRDRRRDRPARAARRRRARPREARRAPVHASCTRRSTWRGSSSRPTRASARRRGGAGSTTSSSRRDAGDRRPTATGCCRSSRTCSSNAFRWTPDGGRIELELDAENGTVQVAVARHRPGDPAGRARADLPAVLVEGRRRHRARPRDRPRARDRARRPDRARDASRGRGAASSSCCPQTPPDGVG